MQGTAGYGWAARAQGSGHAVDQSCGTQLPAICLATEPHEEAEHTEAGLLSSEAMCSAAAISTPPSSSPSQVLSSRLRSSKRTAWLVSGVSPLSAAAGEALPARLRAPSEASNDICTRGRNASTAARMAWCRTAPSTPPLTMPPNTGTASAACPSRPPPGPASSASCPARSTISMGSAPSNAACAADAACAGGTPSRSACRRTASAALTAPATARRSAHCTSPSSSAMPAGGSSGCSASLASSTPRRHCVTHASADATTLGSTALWPPMAASARHSRRRTRMEAASDIGSETGAVKMPPSPVRKKVVKLRPA
mmetsp:Transcript_44784/g.115925  ORF Transcript_44784/g.115925 Transcript_44784/m.115925 type:complete len:312 (-) Transcript_44784:1074-2009(-)